MEQNHGDGKSQALGRVMPQPYYTSKGKVDRQAEICICFVQCQTHRTLALRKSWWKKGCSLKVASIRARRVTLWITSCILGSETMQCLWELSQQPPTGGYGKKETKCQTICRVKGFISLKAINGNKKVERFFKRTFWKIDILWCINQTKRQINEKTWQKGE